MGIYERGVCLCVSLVFNLPSQLFVKATRLEQIQNDYERAQEDEALMKKSIERNEVVRQVPLLEPHYIRCPSQLSEDLKKEAKLLEERLHLFDRLKEMEDKVLV